MKRILIALDYDPSALKVAETGFLMAKAMSAEVTLLHVITDPVYYASSEYSPIMGFTGYLDTNPGLLESAEGLRKASQHFLNKSKKHLGDKTIKTIVKEGDYADSILEAAKETGAAVIVMGSHSRNWMDKVIMGSVTQSVLNHTSIPLLIVPVKNS